VAQIQVQLCTTAVKLNIVYYYY